MVMFFILKQNCSVTRTSLENILNERNQSQKTTYGHLLSETWRIGIKVERHRSRYQSGEGRLVFTTVVGVGQHED